MPDDELRETLRGLPPSARDKLRRVLLDDEEGRWEIARHLASKGTEAGDELADVLVMLSLHPDERQRVEEIATAQDIETLMISTGVVPGDRECHDAQSSAHLRVDFVYPGARPTPVALEISSITAGGDKAGPKLTDAMMRRLSEIAHAEDLGAWLVVVNTEKNLKELEPEILNILRDRAAREELLRTGNEIWLGHYTADDLLALGRESKQRKFMALHERLRSMGLVSIKPVEGEGELLVAVLPVTSVREVVGFGSFLDAVIDDNAAKLGETGSRYEHHLGLLVDRFDASDFPHLTPAPQLPPEVDTLWIIHRWRHGSESRSAWRLARGETEWTVYDLDEPRTDPLESA